MDNDNRAWVEIDGKRGLLDSDGNVLVPVEYENVFFYDKGTAAVMLGGKWGFVDSDNNVIVPFKYDYVSSFSNGLARVVIADGGNAFFPRSFSAPVRNWLKGKFGFVDMFGNEVIPLIYDYADPVFDDNGYVYVELAGSSGMIDTSGKTVRAFERITP